MPHRFVLAEISTSDGLKLVMTISNEHGSTDTVHDAYHFGRNVIHIVDRVLLPADAATFLGLDVIAPDDVPSTPDRVAVSVQQASPTGAETFQNVECCVICYSPTDNRTVCAHRICTDCVAQLDRARCPVCRTPMSSNDHPELSAPASTASPAREGLRDTEIVRKRERENDE